jgi:hypothetical protein
MLPETIKELERIILEARAEVNKEHSLNGVFDGFCDVVSEIIFDKLDDLGYEEIELQEGFYRHTFKDLDLDNYGHYWVVVDGVIIDGTRDQFGSKDYIILDKESVSKIYITKITPEFEIELTPEFKKKYNIS